VRSATLWPKPRPTAATPNPVRLAEAQLSLEAMGDLALQLQSCGNLALSTKLSRAVTEGAIAVELEDREREAILER
jgi:hypothetical protein